MSNSKNCSPPVWQNVWIRDANAQASEQPVARRMHSMINWDQEGILVIFGGVNDDGDTLGDLWTFKYDAKREIFWEIGREFQLKVVLDHERDT